MYKRRQNESEDQGNGGGLDRSSIGRGIALSVRAMQLHDQLHGAFMHAQWHLKIIYVQGMFFYYERR